jgi:predicted transcriptional regulator
LSGAAVGERDWNFDNLEAGALSTKGRFNQECVAFRHDRDLKENLQSAASVTSKTTRAVANRQAGNRTDVLISESAEQSTTQRPISDAAAGAIA